MLVTVKYKESQSTHFVQEKLEIITNSFLSKARVDMNIYSEIAAGK